MSNQSPIPCRRDGELHDSPILPAPQAESGGFGTIAGSRDMLKKKTKGADTARRGLEMKMTVRSVNGAGRDSESGRRSL